MVDPEYGEYADLDAIKLRRRHLGIDPDGPPRPMQPYYTEAQQINEMTAESRKHVRDASLVQALRFT
jgi:hypothetical protein